MKLLLWISVFVFGIVCAVVAIASPTIIDYMLNHPPTWLRHADGKLNSGYEPSLFTTAVLIAFLAILSLVFSSVNIFNELNPPGYEPFSAALQDAHKQLLKHRIQDFAKSGELTFPATAFWHYMMGQQCKKSEFNELRNILSHCGCWFNDDGVEVPLKVWKNMMEVK